MDIFIIIYKISTPLKIVSIPLCSWTIISRHLYIFNNIKYLIIDYYNTIQLLRAPELNTIIYSNKYDTQYFPCNYIILLCILS